MSAGRRNIVVVALVGALWLLAPAGAAAANLPARVQGRYAMRALVTRAVGVRGEHRGERLRRTWRIVPSRCRGDVCRTLHLRRTLSRGRTNRVTLYRRRDGAYVGRGQFFVALSCAGHVSAHGSRARFTITLRVTSTRAIGGIRFARGIAATYDNTSRDDVTSCALPTAHDAARYTGRLRAGAPSPPRASFSRDPIAGGTTVAFADTSRPGRGPGRRIVAWRWNFGDSATGAANRSRRRDPDHAFSGPGAYRVRLTVTDRTGLRSTVLRTVVVPAPPPSARSR